MTGAADYLTCAEKAEARAAKATGAYRAQLDALAAQWRDLARQARLLTEFEERLEREQQAAEADDRAQADGAPVRARPDRAGSAT